MKTYNFMKTLPVARFYYRGEHHTHPVRRTILRIPSNSKNVITGYELREGSTIRSFADAPIKSYRKDMIAIYGDYARLKTVKQRKKKTNQDTTLEMVSLVDLVREGA